jgi:hypothetical protein
MAAACGGRIDLGAIADASVDAADATVTADADPDALNGGRGPAPLPVCTANMQCLVNDQGHFVSGVVIKCDPAPFVGPWNVLLQKLVNGQYQTIQVRSIRAPGFPSEYQDQVARPTELTYRLCTVDEQGTRCAVPLTTAPPPNCGCEALTCDYTWACNTTIQDGCGRAVQCGACTNGTTCNLATQSCCPPGFMTDGKQGCVCAPPQPCPGPLYWDIVACGCEVFTP